MPLIYCEINLIATWSVKCFIVTNVINGQVPKFAITATKLYVPVVTLWTDNNAKLLEQLKPGFKWTINWSKYQSKATIQTQNQCLYYLIDPSFQEVNRLFVLSSENIAHQTSYKQYFLPTVEIFFFLFSSKAILVSQ